MQKKVIFTVCALSLLMLAYFAIYGIRTTRVGTMQELVVQNLKIGTSSEQVIHFLDSQHLEHSEPMKPEFMRLGGHNYGNENVVAAIKRHTARALLWGEAIQIIFVFNEKHELTRFDVFPFTPHFRSPTHTST